MYARCSCIAGSANCTGVHFSPFSSKHKKYGLIFFGMFAPCGNSPGVCPTAPPPSTIATANITVVVHPYFLGMLPPQRTLSRNASYFASQFSSVFRFFWSRPSLALAQTQFQSATGSSEHPALCSLGQASRRTLSFRCPPGQPFKIKHIARYWPALPIAPASPNAHNLSHPERGVSFRYSAAKPLEAKLRQMSGLSFGRRGALKQGSSIRFSDAVCPVGTIR